MHSSVPAKKKLNPATLMKGSFVLRCSRDFGEPLIQVADRTFPYVFRRRENIYFYVCAAMRV